MKARLAYLTSPAPDRYVLNFQHTDTLGNEAILLVEISEGHLANIIADGAHYAFRKQCTHRVPVEKIQTESAHEPETRRQQPA